MARRSPRSRNSKKKAPARVRGAGRTRSTPGSRPRVERRVSASGRHAGKRSAAAGARGTAAAKRGSPRATSRRPAGRPRRARFRPPEPERVAAILEILDRAHPGARCALDFGTPLQLLVATILSAQCTDERVNKVTPVLFARYPDARALSSASQLELEDIVRSTGFFRNKARAIRECCGDLVARHGGEVPRTLEELTPLRGVGRKTANVVLGNAYGIPGLVVDTHVSRLAGRLGLTAETDPVKIEFALMPIVPKERWTIFSHWLILHGRSTCVARKPRCSTCPLIPHCPRLGVTVSS